MGQAQPAVAPQFNTSQPATAAATIERERLLSSLYDPGFNRGPRQSQSQSQKQSQSQGANSATATASATIAATLEQSQELELLDRAILLSFITQDMGSAITFTRTRSMVAQYNQLSPKPYKLPDFPAILEMNAQYAGIMAACYHEALSTHPIPSPISSLKPSRSPLDGSGLPSTRSRSRAKNRQEAIGEVMLAALATGHTRGR